MSDSLLATSQKGSLLLAEIRRKHPGYHPIIAIVDIAHDPQASLELQYNCHKTVAKYIEPELKSIEVKGDFKEQKTVRVSLFDEAKALAMQQAEDVEYIESSKVDQSIGDF